MFIKNFATQPEIRNVHFPERSNVQRVTEWFTLVARMHAMDYMGGTIPSKLAGKSLDFRDLRDYEAGDDFRHVDWKASARTGKWLTRQFHHEAGFHLCLILDTNPGMEFGSVNFTKLDSLILLTTFFSWVAYYSGSKFQIYIPSQSQRPLDFERVRFHTPFQVAKTLATNKKKPQVNWQSFWNAYPRRPSHEKITFLISDFWNAEILNLPPTFAPPDHFHLVRITDQGEFHFPIGLETCLADPESMYLHNVFANSPSVEKFKKNLANHSEEIERISHKKNMSLISLNSGLTIIDEFVRHPLLSTTKPKVSK